MAIELAGTLVVVSYLVSRPLFRDWRDGAIDRVGQGRARSWSPPQSSKAQLTRTRLNSGAHITCMQPEDSSRLSYLLVHDITEHGGALGDIAVALFEECQTAGDPCAIFAVDLPGHGQTRLGTASVEFNMTVMVETVWDVAEWIRSETGDSAVFTLGMGVGGEVAFQASSGSDAITATIANGLLLAGEVKLREQTEMLKGFVGDVLELLFRGQTIFLPTFLSSHRMYDHVMCEEHSVEGCAWEHDKLAYEEHLKDPLNSWFSSFSSLRSLFHHPPFTAASNNTKPVLVLAGAKDKAIPLAHIRECFHRIEGKKYLRFDQRGGHQLLRSVTGDSAKAIVEWSRAVLDGSLSDFLTEAPSLLVSTLSSPQMTREDTVF
eukprot:CAMPEP_0181320696 /NCGR_PEP_ID=MMETSP1101-20121128/18265_1 /TAXON_ID=46948 /ORGANISM="Rhodomonas abbreviata, Strain Caron Lab Isolate" /LENGTH=375 /DNA_ID=CAMNT_0023428425 /DNA_START=57 /DNA_END=1184 /DNA_ORIENTATION=-